ncbi:hypothetical protein SESBI_35216 [Sesbania bispinosa]|nr:hypothetical protein SESBI_35216 [Sesbania bispinosa]
MKKITRMKDILNMKKKPNMKKITRMKDILNMKKKPNMKKIKILNNRKKTRMKKKPNMKKIKILNIMNGFATKRGKVISSRKTGRVLQQNFFCNKEGKRVDSGVPMEERQREPKLRLDVIVGQNFERMWTSTQDGDQMNNMLKVGICPPQLFGSFANFSGGYEKIGFRKKDIYNQIIKQRRLQNSDAEAAVKYFHNLGGFRTTSRCEGLHSELAKFVHSRHNLTDFLHHYNRCVEHMRFREMENDFSSIHGDPVLQTNLQGLERKLSVVNSETIEDFNDAMERSLKEHAEKSAKRACDMASGSEPTLSDHKRLRNPLPARHTGCARASTSTGG